MNLIKEVGLKREKDEGDLFRQTNGMTEEKVDLFRPTKELKEEEKGETFQRTKAALGGEVFLPSHRSKVYIHLK